MRESICFCGWCWYTHSHPTTHARFVPNALLISLNAISLCTPKKVRIEANDGWLFALHISSERTVRVCVTPPYNSFLDLVHPLRVFVSLSSASLISFGRLSIIILEEFWVPYDEHKDGTDSVVRGPLIFFSPSQMLHDPIDNKRSSMMFARENLMHPWQAL